MKRLLVSTFALVALAAVPVAAADLPVRMPVKAAPPAPVMVTWTGCYIGANIGYGFGDKDWFDPQVREAVGSHDINGVAGGGQVGCDFQTGNWVFGIQGMFDGANLKGNHRNPFLYQGFDDYVEHTKMSWFATLTGRLGYAVQPALLLYIKGGVAWVRDKHWETELSDSVYYGSASVTRTGWTIGGGFEYMFMPSWSFFAEYNFMDFGQKTATLNYTYTSPGFIYDWRIKQQVSTVLVGVNFRWNTGSPVVARY